MGTFLVWLIFLAMMYRHPRLGFLLIALVFLKTFPYIGFFVLCLCLYVGIRRFKDVFI